MCISRMLVFCLIAVCCFGCGDGTKNLDWERTAFGQGLEVGQVIRFDAMLYDLHIYKIENVTDKKWVWKKRDWDTEIYLYTYNPADPTYELTQKPYNVHAPIGVVVCKVFNPVHHDGLNRVRNDYPETGTQNNFPSRQHKIEVIGRIASIKRETIPLSVLDETETDISLPAVHVHVNSLNVKY